MKRHGQAWRRAVGGGAKRVAGAARAVNRSRTLNVAKVTTAVALSLPGTHSALHQQEPSPAKRQQDSGEKYMDAKARDEMKKIGPVTGGRPVIGGGSRPGPNRRARRAALRPVRQPAATRHRTTSKEAKAKREREQAGRRANRPPDRRGKGAGRRAGSRRSAGRPANRRVAGRPGRVPRGQARSESATRAQPGRDRTGRGGRGVDTGRGGRGGR